VRDIQDAETVVDCILQLAGRRTRGILNIGTGVGLSVREIAMAVAAQLGKSIHVAGVDRDLASSLIADTRRLQRALSP
jgi:nucleoside-diphosphate-sugar epimerase